MSFCGGGGDYALTIHWAAVYRNNDPLHDAQIILDLNFVFVQV